MDTLYMSIDFGASATKIIYGLSAIEMRPLAMPPHSIEVPRNLLPKRSGGNYASAAWVGIGETYYAIGDLAKSFRAIGLLKTLKSDLLPAKLCAALWVAAQDLGLKNKFLLNLHCVLPPGEIKGGQAQDLLLSLSETLRTFDTPTGEFKVKLKLFNPLPEGMGMYFAHQRIGRDVDNSNIAVAMLGYRNASIFNVRKGSVSGYQSTDLGFDTLVQQVRSVTFDYDTYDLSQAIALYQDTSNDIHLTSILKNTNPERRIAELEKLKIAIESARKYYLTLLSAWFGQVLAIDTTAVLTFFGNLFCHNDEITA